MIIFYKVLKTLLFILISLCFTLFAFHKVPGFFNILAINKVQLSELSIPFSIYLNFDKVMPALIIFSISDLYIRHLSKPAYREEFKEDTERSTAAYIDIREDASTGSTSKFTSRSEVGKDVFRKTRE